MVDGQPKYVLIIHPFTATEMRTATGADNWREITALARERSASNPLYTGALGEYAGVIIHVSEYIPRQISSPLTYNIFLGAQAGCIAFGNAWKRRQRGLGKGSYFSWHEDVDDYGNEEGIGVASIFGIKKTVYNSVDYATIRYVTTDDSHALP
jgi:N4-gp56 family major capsid protein